MLFDPFLKIVRVSYVVHAIFVASQNVDVIEHDSSWFLITLSHGVNMFVVVALPDRRAQYAAGGVHFQGGYGFEILHDRG